MHVHVMNCARAVRRAAGALGATLLILYLATPASAHGGLTVPQDIVQHYGVLLFLVAVVLIGAGVLAWVTLSPQADEDEDQDDAVPPPPAGPAGASEAPITPEGSRVNR